MKGIGGIGGIGGYKGYRVCVWGGGGGELYRGYRGDRVRVSDYFTAHLK